MTQNTNRPEPTKKPHDTTAHKTETAKVERDHEPHKADETRAVLAEDVKALADKFNGSHLKDEAKTAMVDAKNAAVDKIVEVKDSAVETLTEAKDATVEKLTDAKDAALEIAQDAGDRVKEFGGASLAFARANAMPLALIGIGAGWLISSRRDRTSSSAATTTKPPKRARPSNGRMNDGHRDDPSTDSERDSRAGGSSTSAAQIAATAKAKGRQLSEKAQRGGASLKAGIKRAGSASLEYVDSNPLLIATVSVAAGVGIGMLLPPTSRENRWFGASRDQLFGEARETVRGLGDVVRETVEETTQAMR